MRRFLGLLPALFLVVGVAHAQLLAPIVNFGNPHVAASYVGPGDSAVAGAALAWFSCARAYNAAYAVGGASGACDIVDTTTGVATCTIPIGTNGFADMAGTHCPTGSPTVSPTTFCTVTHSGCSITKAYDQTGNGHHVIQATLANMPTLQLSDLNSLPTMNCGTAAALSLKSANITQAQPFTLSGVYIRTSGSSQQSVIGNGVASVLMGSGSTNLAAINAGTLATKTATDNAWHGIQGLIQSTTSALNVDGSDTTGLSAGATAYASSGILLCSVKGRMAEAGIWASALSSTVRGLLFTNQNGTSGYNGSL